MQLVDFYKVLAIAEKVIICELEVYECGDVYNCIKYEGYIEGVPLEYMSRRITQINTLNFRNAITIVLEKE